jgi:lysophospholipase L1-like esterase
MNINREQVEWSNFYWDNANTDALPRVLLIGDSISVGYRPFVEEQLKGKYNVDLFATSKGIIDKSYEKELRYVLSEYKYEVIHFNNGLHGWHITDEDYKDGIAHLVALLKALSNDAKLIWATSTPITEAHDNNMLDEANNSIVIRRNMVAQEVINKEKIKINDLYNLVLGKGEIRRQDKYHYNEEGQMLQAKAVVDSIIGGKL